ncbi:hypothetical protein [Subdoligranulum variabile]|uniref:Lipoprotein n=1 Tax=Subdoligranulum variabile DSM 15176 TaxID=411471 RepID=D1PQ22_9FIRM|nr:hypothetical protein [Subdoligranulum variabile]EFB75214.1 hypothetical protein SUBVAR_06489 [Subdoligranulum variabile DSM 15176]UWP69257.1 hypothetical protein NQ490_05225 [Subdoligranulum variabile]
MKRLALYLLALAIGLSACAPAASTVPEPVPVEATGESATAEESVVFPVGHLRRIQEYESTADAMYSTVNFWTDAGEPQFQLLKVDLTDAQRVSLYMGDSPDLYGVQVLPWQGQICLFGWDTLYKVPEEGGATQEIPLGKELNPEFVDEYAVYEFEYRMDRGSNRGKRIDLETGQITDLELPGQIEWIDPTGTPRFIMTRAITQTPLPSYKEWEAYSALLQSGEREFDWYDPATGAMEKVMAEPFYGEEQPDGKRRRHDFLGMAGDRLYFSWYNEDGSANGVESCALDGSDWQQMPGRLEMERPDWIFSQNGTLRWMMSGEPGNLWIYDLPAGQMYELPHITVANGWPEALVGQNQVLVSRGRDPDIVEGYALISLQDYLAGSTDWTPIEDAEAPET